MATQVTASEIRGQRDPESTPKYLGWLVFACGLLSIAILNIEGPLYETGNTLNAFNFATKAQGARMIQTWGDRLVRVAERSFAVDFVFIVCYVSTLLLAVKTLAPRTQSRLQVYIPYVRAIVVVGGLSDVAENCLGLWNLNGHTFIPSVIPSSLKFVCVCIVLLFVTVLSIYRVSTWKNGIACLIRYIYYLRFPISIIALIVGLAVADNISPSVAKLTRGIFAVESWQELLIGSFIALMLSWSSMIVTRIILAYANDRFGEEAPAALVVHDQIRWTTLALWTLPACVLIARMFAVGEFVNQDGVLITFPEGSLESALHITLHLFVALLALPIAILALFVIDSIRLHEQLPGAGGEHAFALPFRWNALKQRQPWIADRYWFKWIFKSLGAGFYRDDRVRSGHLLATAFVLVLGMVYIAGRYILRPSGNWIHSVPVLYFVVLLASLMLWSGGFLSFWADRYRIPVLLSFLVVISVFNLAFDSDHYFTTANLSGPSVAIQALTPDQIYKGWLERHPNGDDPVVVVTAAGGGIQAAGWTTKVLTELEAETDNCQSHFRDSLLLLSGVSGGSVGTMYYADSYIDSTPDDQVKRLAEQSSLREVAWGIAYFDFWRSVRPTGTDRATAMEEAWGRVWRGQNATTWSGASRKLSEWKDSVAEHDQPAVILNSTIVETGERFLLTNFSIDPKQTGLHEYGAASWSFAHKFPGCDLNIRTAARLSATFPFVSPVPQARGCEGPQRYHFADGGYYDNFGVSSAIDWLRMAGVNKQALDKHKLLWIQVLSFPPTSQTVPSSTDFKNRFGWALQAAAPVMTMNDVRDAGQRERDGIEISYLRTQLNPNQFEELQFVFHGSNPPLSWHLLPSQKASIDESWKSWQLDPDKSTDIDHVKQAFGCSSTANAR